MQWFFRRWRTWLAVLLACLGLTAGLGLPLLNGLLEPERRVSPDAGVGEPHE